VTETAPLQGFVVTSKGWGTIILVLLLAIGLAVSALFWFGVWPLSNVDIFTAYSQVVIAGIAMYAIVTKLDD
jgi:hypothetical protein